MKNLATAIGLEALYQRFRNFEPSYIGRVEFFVEMRKALKFKGGNLVSCSAS